MDEFLSIHIDPEYKKKFYNFYHFFQLQNVAMLWICKFVTLILFCQTINLYIYNGFGKIPIDIGRECLQPLKH